MQVKRLFRGEEIVGAPIQGRIGFEGKRKNGREIRKSFSIPGKEKSSEGESPRALEAEKGFQG
jgi:hypothetical protein